MSGAHLGSWLWQRASAVYMTLFLPVFFLDIHLGGSGYVGWRALFQPLPMKIGVLLFFTALLLHAWIGLREILIDYVHPLMLRLPLYFFFAAAYLACLVWAADILWTIP